MEIIVKTSKKEESYDLSDPANVKKLKQALAKRARQKGFLAIVKDVEAQLLAHQQTSLPANNPLADLLAMVTNYIQQIEKPITYTPYPQQLGIVFLPASTRVNMPVTTDPTIRITALDNYSDYANPVKLQAYLDRSVTTKQKTAQDSIIELAACFWFDFSRTAGFLNRTNDDYTRVLLYITLLKYFFSHNSSAYAAQGYGKTSQQDSKNLLYYYRSQDAHPYLRAAHNTRLLYAQAPEADSQDYGLQNSALTALLIHSLKDDNSYKQAVQSIDANGVLLGKHKPDYFGPFLGYIGSRANNISLLLAALSQPFAKRANQERALTEIIAKPEQLPAGKLTEKIRHEMMTTVLERLLAVKQLLTATQPSIDLHNQLMQARQRQADHILEHTTALAHIKVSHPHAASFVVFEIYPTMDADLRESKNFKEGVTNVLIGFLGGLINYNAQKHGLHVVLQRRQSFGFLRPTITDVGSLRIRFSLGTEPDVYNEVVIASLRQFDALLTTYNFAANKKDRVPLVNHVLQACEQAKGAKETDKTGNYCLKAMRSERDQWAALVVAQSLLASNSEQLQPETAAFAAYINNFIITRVQHEMVKAKDSEQLPIHGFSFVNTAQVKNPAPVALTLEEHVVFSILLNVMHYATQYIAELDNSKLSHSYSLYFVLQKILHNCQKGIAILAYVDDYEITHLYAKANLVIENLLEYLIVLRFLVNPQAMTDEEGKTVVQQLRDYEQQRMAVLLAVPSDAIDLFFNDSGQQAITASLMALNQQCKTDNPNVATIKLYTFPDSYYELAEFIEKTDLMQRATVQNANIWVVDITRIHDLTRELTTLKKSKHPLHTVIIDVTNNSSPNTLECVKATINELHTQGVWVVLVFSSLKHEELGLDKYQAGKSVVLKPAGKAWCTIAKGHLQAISSKAMHPLTAAYRQMVETIFNGSTSPVTQLPQVAAMQRFGIFALVKQTPPPRTSVDTHEQAILARLQHS